MLEGEGYNPEQTLLVKGEQNHQDVSSLFTLVLDNKKGRFHISMDKFLYQSSGKLLCILDTVFKNMYLQQVTFMI